MYTYFPDWSRPNNLKVEDPGLNELFQEALGHDKSLLISEHMRSERKSIFHKRKYIPEYQIYHRCRDLNGNFTIEGQYSVGGDKRIIVTYLLGIINGVLSTKK